MLTDTSIKFLNSSNLNGPLLNTDWGALVRLYDACLVDGINLLNIASLSISGSSPETSDLVTITYLTPHGYQQYQVLLLSGSQVEALNGEHRIQSVSTDGLSLTFKIKTNVVDAGNILNIMTKLAPLGWTKEYSGTNRAVYKMNSSNGPNHYFFVLNDNPNNNGATGYDSTWARYATTGMAEGLGQDFNPQGLCTPTTWSDIYPRGSGGNVIQGAGKVYYAYNTYNLDNIYDANQVQAGNRRWEIYGDNSYFYLFNSNNLNYTSYQMTGCGQYDCIHQGYNYNTFINNNTWDNKTAVSWHSLVVDTNQIIGFTDERIVKSLSNLNSINGGSLRIRSLNGISVSGYNSILNVNGPANLLKAYVIDADNILMGAYKNIYWLGSLKPFINGQVFTQGQNTYKAINMIRSGYEGQIVVKIV